MGRSICRWAVRCAVVACLTAVFMTVLATSSRAQDLNEHLSIRQDSIRSERLDAMVKLRVALPYGYRSEYAVDDSYPVLILLGDDDPTLFSSIVSDLRLLANPFGSAVPSLIVVGVGRVPQSPWMRTSAAMDSLRPNAGGAEAITSFVTTELLPWIHAHFRTHPYTVLAGHSIYGQLAVYAFARDPDAINAAVAISPAFWWLNRQVNDDAMTTDHAKRIASRTAGRLYVAVGEFDPWPIRKAAASFVDHLNNLKVKPDRFSYAQLPDDNHQTIRQSGYISGLRWVFRPISLSSNAVYAAMGGYGRDLDTASLSKAYNDSKLAYAAGATSLGFPATLPAPYLAALVRLPPIDRKSDPIPIYRLICEDYRRWYPKKEPPPVCVPE